MRMVYVSLYMVGFLEVFADDFTCVTDRSAKFDKHVNAALDKIRH